MPYVFNPFTGNFDFTAAGNVVGPASATDNALARFDSTTGKIIQNSTGTLSDTGLLTVSNLTLSTLTSGSVVFAGTGGALSQDNRSFNWENSIKWLSVSSSSQERVSNGSFTGSASGWTLPTGWAYLSNAVTHNVNGTGGLTQPITMNPGERFEVTLTLSNVTVGGVQITVAGTSVGSALANGTFIFRGIVTTTSGGISINPSATGARFTVDDVSVRVLGGGRMITGDLLVQGNAASGVATISATGKSNSNPGTTRHVSLDNTGSNTWIDFKFNNTDAAHIGATSSGEVSTWIGSGGNGASVYHKATNTMISYNVPSTFTHYGYGAFLNGLNAGGTSSPSSTLMSQGGTALKVKYITANQTLDNTATEWIVDPSAAACNGSPTNACSSYTTEATCLARDAHGGCSWFAGNPCSVYNGDESGCTGQTGCTYEQASCSTYNGDQSTCESTTGCSWNNNPQDCSPLNEASCGSTSGCTQNFDYCGNYGDGGGDGTACNAANGGGFCSYDPFTGECMGGSWFVSCSGTYDSYSCDGSYFTGNCTGVYGAACSGLASCGGIDDQANCNNEPGCNWATAISLTLPSITSCPDRDYWIYNASSTNADVILIPAGSETIDHTTSYTLSNYKDWVHISPFHRTTSCNVLNQATCGSTAGCSPQYANCIWDGSTCSGDPSCSGYGDQSSCEAATYYSGCSGNYVVSSNWYVFGK